MALENQASSDRAGYRIPGADHRKWPCRSRSRAVVHRLRGWSGHLLEVNLAWMGSMPSLVVAAGRAKEPVEISLGTERDPIQEAADAVAAIGQEGEALVDPQILGTQHLEQPASWLVIMGLDQAEGAVVPNLRHRLADDDLELLAFVVPVAQVGAVDADDDRPLR